MIHALRYSPHPIEDYVRHVEGIAIGPGIHPLLARDPAAWNLYWLSYPNLESYTALESGSNTLDSLVDPLAEIAVATSRQSLGNTPLRELLLQLPPALLVEEIRRRPHRSLGLARFFKHRTWLDVMAARAALHSPTALRRVPAGVTLH